MWSAPLHAAQQRRGRCGGRAEIPLLVRARHSPQTEGLQVLVYTPDRTDLFTRICGYFDSADFSIVDARIHTTKNGWALDTFQIVTTMLPEHYRELTSMVQAGLTRALQSDAPLPRAEPRSGLAPRQELSDRAAHRIAA